MTTLPNLKDHPLGSRLEEVDFDCCVDHAAASLVGSYLFCDTDSGRLGGIILETEAYCQRDPAAHCYNDFRTATRPDHIRAPRMHDAMYLPAGHIYVYPNSKKWCCFNIVCGPQYFGAGVLVRSILPFVESATVMRKNRGHNEKAANNKISSGPMMLCQALKIGYGLNNKALSETNISLYSPVSRANQTIVSDRRIGIPEKHCKAKDWCRRYVLSGIGNGYHKPLIDHATYSFKPHDSSECSCFSQISGSQVM